MVYEVVFSDVLMCFKDKQFHRPPTDSAIFYYSKVYQAVRRDNRFKVVQCFMESHVHHLLLCRTLRSIPFSESPLCVFRKPPRIPCTPQTLLLTLIGITLTSIAQHNWGKDLFVGFSKPQECLKRRFFMGFPILGALTKTWLLAGERQDICIYHKLFHST